ncbi:hypothetical protein AWB76_03167 [Caballeronia temeraria]|uniref:Uncharacterized protein n=1 Tax=Caballeronia temeraria TaxID=1777137 RepID=A0A158AWJ8_9BURK|nr:hypothetical protein [Caballeronia temeraria]SAK62030.1 hypothetical protein AWB76_03167 [Caballeronia temeraria]
MAARKPRNRAQSLFALMERQIVGLYDAGVMSPAVLHHVVAAYAASDIDWYEEGALHTVDGHTVHEAVVLVMMPGRALKNARKDFLSVVEHLAGNIESQADDEETEAEDDADLLTQLSPPSKTRAAKKNAQTAQPKRAGFNPLVGARAVKG